MASSRQAFRRGFTLLEVMCAFAILGMTTAFVTTMFVEGVSSGTDALANRELREAVDTIFRKVIYEHDKYKDGDTRSMADEYGDFANLRGFSRDRWSIYRFELEKKEETVVGQAGTGETSAFNEDTETGGGGDSFVDTVTGDEDENPDGRTLTRITMKIFREEDSNDSPIFSLTTWIDPEKDSDS